MELKEQIEKKLQILKINGFDRRKIETELNYKEYYIDQVVSKGGNKRFLTALTDYSNRVLQNATSSDKINVYDLGSRAFMQSIELESNSLTNLTSDPKRSFTAFKIQEIVNKYRINPGFIFGTSTRMRIPGQKKK